jgi:hypothetical protein
MEKMRIHNWIKVAMDRKAWKRIVEQAKRVRAVFVGLHR